MRPPRTRAERLEDRLLLAGNVAAAVTGGNLAVTGDDAGNDTFELDAVTVPGNLVIFAVEAAFDGGRGAADTFAPLNAAFAVAPTIRNFE